MQTTIVETSDPKSPLQYTGTVLASNTSVNQSWSILQTDADTMLFIDGQHQSSKSDEDLYHETMVHSLLCGLSSPKKILILGGAEGCLAREVLRWNSVEHVTQVDWDTSLLDYYRKTDEGRSWNDGAYEDPRLTVVVENALVWLHDSTEQFDAIFIDLLDPSDNTMPFLKMLLKHCKTHLTFRGGLSINAGLVSSEQTSASSLATFIQEEYRDSRFLKVATKVHVSSFLGTWGFLQIIPQSWSRYFHDTSLPHGLKYATKETLLEGTLWNKTYPKELRDFWIGSIETVEQKVCKKLTSFVDPETRRLTDYYGC
jgi:spermidine synthase